MSSADRQAGWTGRLDKRLSQARKCRAAKAETDHVGQTYADGFARWKVACSCSKHCAEFNNAPNRSWV
jgi:hypothetical protein